MISLSSPRRAALAVLAVSVLVAVGCKNHQQGRIKSPYEEDRVGSHAAGTAVWEPLVDGAVGKMLESQAGQIQPVSYAGHPGGRRICFVGVENAGMEELGSFRAAMEERIETQIANSRQFSTVSRHYVDAALKETRIHPSQLFLPDAQMRFAAILGRQNQSFDYFLFAKVTSTNTQVNRNAQRDYALTLELVDVGTGEIVHKNTVELAKDYNKSAGAKFMGMPIWHP